MFLPGRVPNRQIWNAHIARYRRRGISGWGSGIALAEWRAAAGLWHEHFQPADGWVADFGSGNAGFWQLVTKPERLILLDIVDFGLNALPGQVFIGNAAKTPFRANSLSAIVALGLCEYLDDLDAACAEWRHIARDGCKLLVTNSPPLMVNRIRGWCDGIVRVRSDHEFAETLVRNRWSQLTKTPIRAGWQSVFVAIAV